MEPISAVVSITGKLIGLLGKVKQLHDERADNKDVMQEIKLFITQLERNLHVLKDLRPRNNSSRLAAASLLDYLRKATDYVDKCLKMGYFKSMWNVHTVKMKVARIRENVLTQFQITLQCIQTDVSLNGQREQEEFQHRFHRSQAQSLAALDELSSDLAGLNSNIGTLTETVTSMREEAKESAAAACSERQGILKRLLDLETRICSATKLKALAMDERQHQDFSVRHTDPNKNRELGKSRGLALIVSMESGRPEAGIDRGRLKTLASACGFSPVHQEASELIDTIKYVAESSRLEEDEAFVCFINGHGGTQDGQLYIINKNKEKIMVIRDIVEPFRHSIKLLGKPKIFLVHCCFGMKLHDNSSAKETDYDDHGAHDGHDDQQGIGSPLPPLEEVSDCLLVISTSEGCRSCHHKDTGTIFVETLVETVTEQRQTMDVLNMMTMVNERVTKVQNSHRLVDGTKVIVGQCCEVRSFLRKKLYWR